MKKFLGIFISGLLLVLSVVQVKAGGYTIYDSIEDYPQSVCIMDDANVNIIKGVTSVEAIKKTDMYKYYKELEEAIESATINVVGLFNYDSNYFEIVGDATYAGGKLTKISISINGATSYVLDFTSDVKVVTNVEYHCCDDFEFVSTNSSFIGPENMSYGVVVYKEGYTKQFLNDRPLDTAMFTALRGTLMKYNSKYEGKDVHLIVEQDNLLPLETLLSDMVITDKSEETISSYTIVSSEYDHLDSPTCGAYFVRVLAKDTAGNCVIQDCYVDVVDGKAPVINITDITVNYNDTLTAEQVLEKISITDSSEITAKNVDLTAYNAAKRKCGTYPYSITATDAYGNTITAKANIIVKDNLPPVVVKKDLYVSFPYDMLTDEQIRAAIIEAKDEVDGVIDTSNIKLKDEDDYQNNYGRYGTYRFTTSIVDKAGNAMPIEIKIHVLDTDYPEIEFTGYAIFVSQGQALKHDDILAILKSTGQISSIQDVARLSSLYFSEDKPQGDYDLEIEMINGDILHRTLSVTLDPDLDYDAPEVKDDSNLNSKYLGASIFGILGTSLLILGVVVIKRKH